MVTKTFTTTYREYEVGDEVVAFDQSDVVTGFQHPRNRFEEGLTFTKNYPDGVPDEYIKLDDGVDQYPI